MSEPGRMILSRRAILLGSAATLLAGCATSRMASAGAGSDAADLTACLADVRAIREIKRLQHVWAHYAQAGQWPDMARLFAADGLWTDGTQSVTGRTPIEAHLRSTMGGDSRGLPAGHLNLRLFLSPVITLAPDGQSARGRWHEVAMTGVDGQSAGWAGGIHVIDYVRVSGDAGGMGGWAIARMHYHPQFAGPYDKGWTHVAPSVPMVPFHYTPDQAGNPWGAKRAAPSPLPVREIAGQADLLVSQGLVQNLQAAFGFYLDRKMDDDIVDLFTEDAFVDIAGTGQFVGHAGVRRALALFGEAGLKTGELNDRPQLMPVVTMDAGGRSATVRNIEIGMTGQHGGETYWSATIQDFTCARGDDGRWRITALRRVPVMRAAYAKGWQTPLAAGLPSVAAARPDRPSQLADASYPGHRPAMARFADALAPAPSFASTGDAATLLARAAAFDGAENIADAYGYYIDEFRWDDTADLFATDGWKELSYIGTYVGRERVRGSLFGRYGNAGRSAAFMAIHQKTQPYVTVSEDGMRANIRLRLFQFNSAAKGQGSWISGIYENQAVLENGVWRIHGMDLDYVWLADYAGGWAAIVPGASERYRPKPEDVAKNPPDGPLRGVTFAPYPAIAPMGFHFANPVSGRAPETFLHWSDGRRAAATE
ncbi:hypothetical protein M2337_001511 [Sphingobium sp. B2D3A]|uniref:nuclear transport factor 2 family protein n=1 Tax=unclassified Sphingobium TaxID=2611147 RepID=UPI002223EFDF|nr:MULTISPECIES: nuclear transport factor 2 family protein [unclassified Sphingobium]MCW2337278.1 hypothetical protein [Sphingobium sp. B2D3A]MCW2383736.1 hypothetical protein [Sphingobium sp. B2D3D]